MSSFCPSSEGSTGAHQNTLESVPVVVVTWVLFSSRIFRELISSLETHRTLIGGLHYPIPVALACGFWSFTRILYTIRYGTGEPKKVFFFSYQSQPGI
jgi:glutathione S-transferase